MSKLKTPAIYKPARKSEVWSKLSNLLRPRKSRFNSEDFMERAARRARNAAKRARKRGLPHGRQHG